MTPAADPGSIVVMGVVVAAHGVRGHVKVRAFTEMPDTLLGFGDWWVRPRGGKAWRKMHCVERSMHGDTAIALLDAVTTREAALAMRGHEIGVPRDALPKPRGDEIYWSDLIGFEVVNRAGKTLGEVSGVTEHGAHPLLRVAAPGGAGAGGERLIPYVPAIVDAVDVPGRRIVVDWQPDY